jgi:hypothetical protein
MLLQFAKSTSDPGLSAVLVEKAVEMKARIDENPHADMSATAPDVLRGGDGR